MAFTQREKMIIAATLAALCLLGLDVYVLTPLLDRRAATTAQRARLLAKLAQARSLLNRRRRLERTWRDMLASGMNRDPAEAESQLLRSLRDWSAKADVTLSSLRPERSAEKTELCEIIVHAAGTGSMAAVSRLVWQIETAPIPVKVKMLQLGSRKDGMDDLSLHLKASMLYLPESSASLAEAISRPRPVRGDR